MNRTNATGIEAAIMIVLLMTMVNSLRFKLTLWLDSPWLVPEIQSVYTPNPKPNPKPPRSSCSVVLSTAPNLVCPYIQIRVSYLADHANRRELGCSLCDGGLHAGCANTSKPLLLGLWYTEVSVSRG